MHCKCRSASLCEHLVWRWCHVGWHFPWEETWPGCSVQRFRKGHPLTALLRDEWAYPFPKRGTGVTTHVIGDSETKQQQKKKEMYLLTYRYIYFFIWLNQGFSGRPDRKRLNNAVLHWITWRWKAPEETARGADRCTCHPQNVSQIGKALAISLPALHCFSICVYGEGKAKQSVCQKNIVPTKKRKKEVCLHCALVQSLVQTNWEWLLNLVIFWSEARGAPDMTLLGSWLQQCVVQSWFVVCGQGGNGLDYVRKKTQWAVPLLGNNVWWGWGPRSLTTTEVHYFPIMGHPRVLYSAYTTVTNNYYLLVTFIFIGFWN